MSVRADQLSKSGARSGDIDGIVREQLRIIDEKLLRHERIWGHNVVMFDLPTQLSLPGLNLADAQRIVYAMIIRSIDERLFETRLLLNKETQKNTLFISWMTDLDATEVEAMNALISSKVIRAEEVADFIANGNTKGSQAATVVRNGRGKQPEPMHVTNRGRVMQPRGGVAAPASAARDNGGAESNGPSAAEKALLGGGNPPVGS
jgi:hypothetical protein